MAYKDILVYLDPTPFSGDRLRVAIGLAKAHAARLIAVDASSDDAFLGAWSKSALQIEPTFSEAVETAGIEAEFIGGGNREGTRHPDYLHRVDLMISPRPEGEDLDRYAKMWRSPVTGDDQGPVSQLPPVA